MSAAAGPATPHRAPAGPWRSWSGQGGGSVCAGVTGALRSAWRPLPAVTSTAPGARLGAGSCPGGILLGAAQLGGLRDSFPPGLPAAVLAAAPEPSAPPAQGAGSGPAATSGAGSDLEAIAGSRRCRETTCPCLLRREAQRGRAAAAGAQPREDTAPETPGLPERRAKGSAGAEGLRGSREWGGGYSRSSVVPPGRCLVLGPCLALQGMALGKRLLSGAVPAPGQGCPVHEVFGLCRSVPRQIAVSIPCRACSGVAAACVWVLPCTWEAVDAMGSCCCRAHPVRHFPPFVSPRMCSGSPAAWDLLVPTATVPVTLSQCDHVSPLLAPSPSRAATFPVFSSPRSCLWPSECPFWVGFSCFALDFAVHPHQQWAVRL